MNNKNFFNFPIIFPIIAILFLLFFQGCWWGTEKSIRNKTRVERYTLKTRGRSVSYRVITPVRKKKKKSKKIKYKGPRTFYAIASYYGRKFHGKKTASGEIFNMFDYTAAHKSLPFGTLIKVTNLKNHRAVIVRVNDRGPFVKGRDLDLSYAAAKSLGIISEGVAKVKVEIIRLK